MKTFKGMATEDVYEFGEPHETFGAIAHAHSPPFRFEQPPYPSVIDDPVKPTERQWLDVMGGRSFISTERINFFF